MTLKKEMEAKKEEEQISIDKKIKKLEKCLKDKDKRIKVLEDSRKNIGHALIWIGWFGFSIFAFIAILFTSGYPNINEETYVIFSYIGGFAIILGWLAMALIIDYLLKESKKEQEEK